MNGRYFLDTNIFVYAFDSSFPVKARIADDLIRSALSAKTGAISYQVVQEFYSAGFRRFPGPLQGRQAEIYLSTVLIPLCAVQSSPTLFARALHLFARYHLQWYDALIISGATEAKCGILYSEDFQHSQKFDGVEICNPFL